MKKHEMLNWGKLLLLVVLCLISCFFLDYSATVSNLNYDAYSYYGIARDVFQDGGHYFDWDAAPGTNLFEFRYLYTYLIGSFSNSSYILFFNIANLTEIFLFILSCYGFLILIDRSNLIDHKPYFYLAPAFLVIWLIPGTPLVFFSDLFLLTINIFILFFIGLFINILSYVNEYKRLPVWRTVVFSLFILYLSATNLRFASSGAVNYLCFLTLLFLIGCRNLGNGNIAIPNNKKKIKQEVKLDKEQINFNISFLFPKVNRRTFFILAGLLLLLIGIGYLMFFNLETYSTTKRYVYLYSTHNVNQAPFLIVPIFFDYMLSGVVNFILSIIALLMLSFGAWVWLMLILGNPTKCRALLQSCPLTAFFCAFAFLCAVTMLVTGVFQGGVHVWSEDKIRYFEIPKICIYVAFSTLLIERVAFLRKNGFKVAVIVLSISLIYSIYNFSQNYTKAAKPYFDVYSCIKNYKAQYHLQGGMGSSEIMRQIRSYGDKTTGLDTYMLGGSLPIVNAFWVNTLYQRMSVINYLVYMDKDVAYSSQAIALLNQMVPNVKTTPLTCGSGDSAATILVLDDSSASMVTAIFKQYMSNARSFFAVTNYGWEQTMWKHMPWHQKYIAQNHTLYFNGLMLEKANAQASYTNNDDLSVSATSIPSGQAPIFSSGYVYVGNSKFSTTLTYSSGQNLILAAVNLQTGSVIKAWNVPATFGNAVNSVSEEFSVNADFPMTIMIVSANNTTPVTVKGLTLSWEGFSNN